MRTPAPNLRRVLLACLVAASTALPVCAGAQVYPRLGLYGSIQNDGSPYLTPSGTLDYTVVNKVARYHEVILDAHPISDYHPEVAQALRSANPGIRLIAYVIATWHWNYLGSDSLHDYASRYTRLLRNNGGYLYAKSGALYSMSNVNLAKRDAGGRYVIAESLAVFFNDAVARTGLWNGMFLDVNCDRIDWSQTPQESIDVVRAGYADLGSFDLAWKAGIDTLSSRLRQLAGPGFTLVGNCGQGVRYAWYEGWMRENFPYQNGGTWYENMFRVPGGYFTDEASFRQPPDNWIFSIPSSGLPYDGDNARRVRFGLGSAALGRGFSAFGPSDRNSNTMPYHDWWYDEYAVDVPTGRSTGLLANTGWLGAARGPWYQMIWVGTAPDAVTNSDFETDVTTGWQFWGAAATGATVAQDATTAARGLASARIHVTTPGVYDWYVSYTGTGSIYANAWGMYSATFWARSSTPRAITVVAAPTAGGTDVVRTVNLTTSWTQYQVVLQPMASGYVRLRFYVGQAAGDIWVDDVHFQAGVTNLYRRDFDNGLVLVNPASSALTAPLGANFRKILGTVAPSINDGTTVSQVTIGASDALFMLNVDTVPPATIKDLRVVH